MSSPPASGPAIAIGPMQIPAADVRLVVAEAGISLAGGEMLIWKRNVVVTPAGPFVSKADPLFNALFFDNPLAACPHAVGILTNGTVRLPRLAPTSSADPLQLLRESLSAVKTELSR